MSVVQVAQGARRTRPRNFGILTDKERKTRASEQYKGGNEREGMLLPPYFHKMTTRMAVSKGRGRQMRRGA